MGGKFCWRCSRRIIIQHGRRPCVPHADSSVSQISGRYLDISNHNIPIVITRGQAQRWQQERNPQLLAERNEAGKKNDAAILEPVTAHV